MVDIGEGDHGGNYDVYEQGINASVDPGYDAQYYYGSGDGAGDPGHMDGQHGYLEHGEYGSGGYNTGMGTGLRKRNIQGGGSGGINEGEVDPNKVHLEVGNNSSGEENQTLLAKKKTKSERLPRCYGLRRAFGCIVSQERRSLTLQGRRRPGRYPTNRQNNRKYNICTLVPMVLFNQFKFFYNFFFLVIALT